MSYRGGRNANQSSWSFEDFGAPEQPTNQGRPGGDSAANRPIYKTSGDGMGGRRVPVEDDDEPPVRNTRASQNRRNNDDEEQPRQGNKGTVDQLGGEGRTIYRLHGDGMGGRKVALEEEETPVKAPRTMSAAKKAELGYRDEEVGSNKEVEQLAGGDRTIYKTQGDGMGGRKGASEEEALPARAPRGFSAAKRAEMGYDDDEDLNQQMGKVELLGGGSKTIYRTQGDGMGGRKVVAEEKPAIAPRAFSAAKRAEMGFDYDEVEPKKEAELLGGGGRTIYKTQGDGMGGRKVVAEETESRVQAPRGISAAKRAEMGYYDDDIEEKSTKEVEQLGGGTKTIYRTQGDGMGGRKVVAEEAPVASRTISAAKKAEMHREEVKPSGKVEQLAGGSRTIYKTSGDGMGGRKGASTSFWGYDEEEPVEQPKRGVRNDNQPSSHWDF